MTITRTKSWTGPNRTGEVQLNLVPTLGRRVLTVSRVEDLTPWYKRFHLTGEDLADGFPYVHLAPTDHVKVLFPQPGATEVVIPERGPNGWITPEGAPAPVLRDYTVRGWLPESRELVLEFVVHGHGVGSAWAEAARVGHQLGVLGPRGNKIFPENYARYLLAGDESALPTLSRFAEELPGSASVQIVVEVAGAGERRTLTGRSNVQVSWVLRDEEGPGGLERALRALELPEGEDWFVFGAGEAGDLKGIRDYFRLELGLPRQRVLMDGYWKRGLANLDHHSIDLNAD